MVAVAQLVERWIVAPVVVGSNPIGHPILLQVANECCLIRGLEISAMRMFQRVPGR